MNEVCEWVWNGRNRCAIFGNTGARRHVYRLERNTDNRAMSISSDEESSVNTIRYIHEPVFEMELRCFSFFNATFSFSVPSFDMYTGPYA